MTRRSGSILPIFLLAFAACGTESRPQPDHTNVVLISVDTLRQDHLPSYGYEKSTAPALARLARSSLVFDNALAVNTNTAPAHASMFTGLYPARHGIIKNGYALDDGIETLAGILGRAGFQTAGFTSGWTLKKHVTGLDRGFETYHDGETDERETKAPDTFRRAADWLAGTDRARPVFLFFHLFDPHYLYNAPGEYGHRFLEGGAGAFRYTVMANRKSLDDGPREGECEEYVARYDGEVAYADETVGKLIGLLTDIGRFENSLIVFVSDHGETLCERETALLDHGGRVYHEQIRIPFVMRLPGGAEARRLAAGVSQVDILPTVLDYLDLEMPATVHGISLLDAIDDAGPAADRPLFSQSRAEPKRVPHLEGIVQDRGLVTSVTRRPHKLIRYPTGDGHVFELFDIERDPLERTDLAAEHPDTVTALAAEIEAWRQRVGGSDSTPPPALSETDTEALRSLGYVE